MALYAIAVILVAIKAGNIERLLTEFLCLLSTVVSAAAPQTVKQTPFREQEDLCTRGQEDSCARNVASDDVFTFKGASDSPGPSFPRQRDRSQRPYHLVVGVATAHFIVTLKMGVHIPFPKLAHFHVLM